MTSLRGVLSVKEPVYCPAALKLLSPWKWIFVIVLLGYASRLTEAQQSVICSQRNSLTSLSLEEVASAESLSTTKCDVWTLPSSTVDAADCPADGSHFLLFEFWRLNSTNQLDTRVVGNVFFVLARGLQPNLTLSTRVFFDPPRSGQPPYSGTNGTLIDQPALEYFRPYHRILVPVNASATNSKNTGTRDWFLTVANMEVSASGFSFGYNIQVSCVAEDTVPCPRLGPQAPECSGQGTCGQLPGWTNAARPALNKVCYCDGDWGNYACQTPVKRVTSSGDMSSAEVPPTGWAYWQFSVPQPPAGYNPASRRSPPALLVELSRTYVSPSSAFGNASALDWPPESQQKFGGNPILMVMPKGVNDSNRLPSWSDLKPYADWESFKLEQNLHYITYRDLPATFPLSPAAAAGASSEFYVAVLNYRYDDKEPVKPANVTLRVRWVTDPTPDQPGPLCPGDCFGRGVCYDPWDPAAPVPLLPPAPGLPKPDFQCACQTGYGGQLCEGTLTSLAISTSGDGRQATLQPGQWSFYLLNIDPQRFNYRSDDITIQWAVRDGTTDRPWYLVNAFLTVDMQAFPRGPQPLDTGGYRAEWQVYYSDLFPNSQSPRPLLLPGYDLRPGYPYVMAVYNSDYSRQHEFTYGLWLYVPKPPRTWLHPYMSVVLGVTASIIICLLLTLCRRLVQRYGWGPFRNRDPEGQGGQGPQGARVQVGPPRPRGVPSSILETFYSYDYTASKAEKQQLAKSNRDQQQQQQQQQEQERQEQEEGRPRQSTAEPPPATTTTNAAAVTAPAAPPDAVVVDVRTGGNTTVAGGGGGGADRPASARAVLTPAGAGGRTADAGTGGAGSGGSGGSSNGSGDDDDEPQCTVCLCEYEEGEKITRLPCNHEFHATCITKWLQTHYTCPICRVSLVPEEPETPHAGDPEAAAAAAGAPGPAPTALTPGDRRQSRRRSHSLTAGPPGAVPPPPPPPPSDGPARVPAPLAIEDPPARGAPPPPPAGFMGRLFGGHRRGPAAATTPVSPAGGAAPRRQSDSGQAVPTRGSVGTNNQFGTTQPRGVGESLSSGENSPSYIATGTAAQVLAHGPTATLDSPGSNASGGSGARPSMLPVSPVRRHVSSRVAALPPAADSDGAVPASPQPSSLNGWMATPRVVGGSAGGAPPSPAASVAAAAGTGGGSVRDTAVLTFDPPPPPRSEAAALAAGGAPADHPLAPSPTPSRQGRRL